MTDPAFFDPAPAVPVPPPGAPRVSRVRAAIVVIVGMALAGVVVGAAWAWLAPPARAVVALTRSGDRVNAYVGSEADHLFIGAFLMLGMPSVLGVVAAVLVWQWRAHRGPLMVAALSLGSVAATATAAGVGAWLAHMRYGVTTLEGAPVTPEHRIYYFSEAPPVFFGHSPLQIAATVLVPAAVAALVYALLTVGTMRDDLGAWPPVAAAPVLPAPVGSLPVPTPDAPPQ